MNVPTPAIVAQGAVRRLPRLGLLLLCLVYVLAGFVGREPWKSNDMSAFGHMLALARGQSDWLSPMLLGLPAEPEALLPYWLGAWALQWAPTWVAPDLAARVPFGLLLALCLAATWYAVYYLARSPRAQPVAFAFGGEAPLADYARAMADGGLLALIACLGLAQLSHETTPAQAQLCFTALAFFAGAAMPYRQAAPALALVAGLGGLTLSGAPSMALLLGLGIAAASAFEAWQLGEPTQRRRALRWAGFTALLVLGNALLAQALDLWRWRIDPPGTEWREWRNQARLLLWFAWPAWPLALWTLWRWRAQLAPRQLSRHLILPLWFVAVATATSLSTQTGDRSLLLALPAMATLAAFALPTFRRSAAALIDWLTLVFFSGTALVIWVVWIAMQTGVPAQPAANVARLVPGFVPSFSALPFALALAASLAWAWLVKWRVGRHRSAIWKSLVLPAGGAALSWLLLMTLWLPLLDYARSYAPLVHQVAQRIGQADCVEAHGLSRGQIAAFQYHGGLNLRPVRPVAQCPWLIADADAKEPLWIASDMAQWTLVATLRRPSDDDEDVLLYRRR